MDICKIFRLDNYTDYNGKHHTNVIIAYTKDKFYQSFDSGTSWQEAPKESNMSIHNNKILAWVSKDCKYPNSYNTQYNERSSKMEIRVRDVISNKVNRGFTSVEAINRLEAGNQVKCKKDYGLGYKGCSEWGCRTCFDKTMEYMENYEENPDDNEDDNDDDQDWDDEPEEDYDENNDPCYNCNENCEGCQYND